MNAETPRWTPLTPERFLELIEFEAPHLSPEARQQRLETMERNFSSGRFNLNETLLLIGDQRIVGVSRWRPTDRDGEPVVQTFGSPRIVKSVDRSAATERLIEVLQSLAAQRSARLELTLAEESSSQQPPELFARYGLTLKFHSRAYGRSLGELEDTGTPLKLMPITEDNLGAAADLLRAIQNDSPDPTAAEDLEDPLETLRERIENGERLTKRGGRGEDWIVTLQDKSVGLLLVRFTHPLEGYGGLFLGIVPELRGHGLGRQLHWLGLQRLSHLGASKYRGETFVGNRAMQRVFALNGCGEIPNSNYWEYSSDTA